ncbi:MAG TPA: LacI family DNA-binding transcriptional regulator, partial [Phnomibacter sp.]|nr:LacI family DNA-binding transcriptional regulator [Phnomibacter sp.]
NVSVSTVSRALHNHPSIGLRTKMRVQELAEQLQYEPNQAAIHFKQKRTYIIGVVLPHLAEEFFSLAMNGIEDTAQQHRYSVLIGQSHNQTDREQQITAAMRRNRVDGLLVSLAKNTTQYHHFKELEDMGTPVFFFDREPTWPQAWSVQTKLEESTYKLIYQLLAEGHRQIGFIQGPAHFSSMKERLNGYTRALQAYKIKPTNTLLVRTDLSSAATTLAMEKLMALKKPPTAVLCFNDYVAFDAIHAARHHYGNNLTMQFVSYANLPVNRYVEHGLRASIDQFPYEQGKQAVELLLQRLQNEERKPAEPLRIYLDSEIVMHA